MNLYRKITSPPPPGGEDWTKVIWEKRIVKWTIGKKKEIFKKN
jgi:hypothetical protein